MYEHSLGHLIKAHGTPHLIAAPARKTKVISFSETMTDVTEEQVVENGRLRLSRSAHW